MRVDPALRQALQDYPLPAADESDGGDALSLEDRERLASSPYHDPYLKRGLVEYEIHPYNLESGGDNLLTSSLAPPD